MKIAFDLHGVLEKYPKQFKTIFGALKGLGMTVCVMSGPPRQQIFDELRKIGFFPTWDYIDHVYSIVDFLKEQSVEMWQDKDGNWWCDDVNWWSSKGNMCEKYKVNVLIDDRTEYFEYFPIGCKTQFIHLDKCDFDQFVVRFFDMLRK